MRVEIPNRGFRINFIIIFEQEGFIKADVMAEFVRWMLMLAVCWLQYIVVSWHRRCVIVVKIRDLIIERQKERFMRPTNAKQVVNGSIMAKVIKAIKCHANEVNEPQIIYLYILHDAHVCDIRYFVKKSHCSVVIKIQHLVLGCGRRCVLCWIYLKF